MIYKPRTLTTIAVLVAALLTGCQNQNLRDKYISNPNAKGSQGSEYYQSSSASNEDPSPSLYFSIHGGFIKNRYEALGIEEDSTGAVLGTEIMAWPWFRLGSDVSIASGEVYQLSLRHYSLTTHAKVFPLGSIEIPVQPYAMIGYSQAWGSIDDLSISADGLATGGGIDFLIPETQLFLRTQYLTTEWSSGSDLDGLDTDNFSFSIGVRF